MSMKGSDLSPISSYDSYAPLWNLHLIFLTSSNTVDADTAKRLVPDRWIRLQITQIEEEEEEEGDMPGHDRGI